MKGFFWKLLRRWAASSEVLFGSNTCSFFGSYLFFRWNPIDKLTWPGQRQRLKHQWPSWPAILSTFYGTMRSYLCRRSVSRTKDVNGRRNHICKYIHLLTAFSYFNVLINLLISSLHKLPWRLLLCNINLIISCLHKLPWRLLLCDSNRLHSKTERIKLVCTFDHTGNLATWRKWNLLLRE